MPELCVLCKGVGRYECGAWASARMRHPYVRGKLRETGVRWPARMSHCGMVPARVAFIEDEVRHDRQVALGELPGDKAAHPPSSPPRPARRKAGRRAGGRGELLRAVPSAGGAGRAAAEAQRGWR